MKRAIALLVFSAIVFFGVAPAKEKTAEKESFPRKVYRGEVVVPENLRVNNDVPEKFSYVFLQAGEGRGVLKISSPDYYYWVFVHDWNKMVFGQVSCYIKQYSAWHKVEWQNMAPAKELDFAIILRVRLFMGLIEPHIGIGGKKGGRR